MSKSRRGTGSSRGTGASKEGSESSPLAPSGGGPQRVTDLGLAALNWLATELDMPISEVISTLEANPAILESAGRIAQTQADRAPTDTGGTGGTQSSQQTQQSSNESSSTGSSADPLGILVAIEDPLARLWIPEVRPTACQIDGSQVVQTPGLFTIELSKYDIRIYNAAEQQITRIWGDPHVNEHGGGDDWHFGNDSTFVLTDGTKICLDTEKNAGGEWLVEGIDIIAGNDRYHFGTGDKDGMHKDGMDWDKANADVAAGDESAGMFALKPDGTWAMRGTDGHFYDVKDESWGSYQSSNDVDIDSSKRTTLSNMQQYATMFDHLPSFVEQPRGGVWDGGVSAEVDIKMKLQVPKERPRFLKYRDSSIIQTPMGYTVELRNTEVIIWDIQGKQITRIWGDPHVNEKNGGDNWHFGGNSTFILPDGAKIFCDTEPIRSNFWVVVGVDVILGDSRFNYKRGGQGALSDDGLEYDKANTDADNRSDAGIFALTPSGEWAVMGRDGYFYDITDESWAAYKKDPDVDLDKTRRVNITGQQGFASRQDQLPDEWLMPVIGDVHKVTRSEFEADVKTHMAGLAKVMPAGHMELINEHAPGIFPALAMDLTLAQFVANMSEDGLKMLLRHAPQLIVQKVPSDAPQGGEWPGPGVAGGPAPQIPNWWA